ncbi:MAG: hypothetical protein NTW21_18510 [Verrucomicrobia bacterium]|nr:hypothetical protein [Verrucomicrobiota bacterium]
MNTLASRIRPLFLFLRVSVLSAAEPHRQALNLDGTWQIAEGNSMRSYETSYPES